MPAGPFLIALIAALVTPFIGLAQGSESGKVVREAGTGSHIIGAPVSNSMGIELGRVADVSFDVADPTMFACIIIGILGAGIAGILAQSMGFYTASTAVLPISPNP